MAGAYGKGVPDDAESAGAPETAVATVPPRHRICAQRSGIDDAVHQSGAPGGVVGVLPIRGPSDCSTESPDDSDSDRGPAGLPEPGRLRAGRIDAVKDQGRCPGSQGYVGERGMYGVPQPVAVQ